MTFLCERIEPTRNHPTRTPERRVVEAESASAALVAFRRPDEATLIVRSWPEDAASMAIPPSGVRFLWAEPADGRRRRQPKRFGRAAFPGASPTTKEGPHA